MSEFAETVTMTREEWLKINRALAGASLGLQYTPDLTGKERLRRVNEAQDTMSEIHQRANLCLPK